MEIMLFHILPYLIMFIFEGNTFSHLEGPNEEFGTHKEIVKG